MAFKLENIPSENFSLPITSKEALGEFEKIKKEFWPNAFAGGCWAVDWDKKSFLLMFPLTRDRAAHRYAFVTDDGFFGLEMFGYCRFRLFYESPRLIGKADKLIGEMREAFRVSGELMDGCTDEKSDRAVPTFELQK